MDSLFEILVAVSVIWSLISSFTSNKKKQAQKQQGQVSPRNNPEELSMEEIFSKLSSSLGVPPENLAKPEIIQTESKLKTSEFRAKTESTTLIHEFPTHKKRSFQVHTPTKRVNTNSRVSRVKMAEEYQEAVDHEHFDTSIKAHHSNSSTAQKVETRESEYVIDVERLFSADELRETILLNEVLDKPKALRRR